ncbi:hypothetical protein DL93DRAFT_1679982 [Clavulina sp. PMI_390]|nr:hypothetical protein DL93DRAFT_1679982 [Clavulina sp. PMI_390]
MTTSKLGSLSGPLRTIPPSIPYTSSSIPAPSCPTPGTALSSSLVGPSTSSNEACTHARMAALCADLPRTTKKSNRIEIGRVWEKIRQHEGFEECDIDELCNELSPKAWCDGSRPVLEVKFDSTVRGLGEVHQQKSTAPLGAVSGSGVPMSAQ